MRRFATVIAVVGVGFLIARRSSPFAPHALAHCHERCSTLRGASEQPDSAGCETREVHDAA